MKKRIGITGQIGFIGTHLANYLLMKPDEIEIIPFEDTFYDNREHLSRFVSQCDAIFHLAAMNRGNPKELYECNIRLVNELIDVMEETKHNVEIIYASSIQEDRDNPYGNSKKEGRRLFEEWSARNGTILKSLIIPNVFGPFGAPYYNSAIATFCYQLTHNLEPKIEIDAEIKLIYINDLIDIFYKALNDEKNESIIHLPHIAQLKVSEILEILIEYKKYYFIENIIPNMSNYFDICLFNTFRSYIDSDHFPVNLDLKIDQRGTLAEVIKSKNGGQVFFSITKPGISRGNHFHRRKVERFCVLEGEAVIKLRRLGTESVIKYEVSGVKPSFVDIPIFYTHNITNVGFKELYTLFWSNESYDPGDPDTYFQEV